MWIYFLLIEDYDFELNKETIWECEIITLEKDNNIYDSINVNNYKYFINTLANKIQLEKENEDTFNNFPQRRYDFKDLENKILGNYIYNTNVIYMYYI